MQNFPNFRSNQIRLWEKIDRLNLLLNDRCMVVELISIGLRCPKGKEEVKMDQQFSSFCGEIRRSGKKSESVRQN